MKNLIFRLILMVFILGLSSGTLRAGDITYEQEIDLRKQNPSGPPRAPSIYPVSFSASLFMDEITIGSQNYTGDITVQITGISGSIIQTLQISASTTVVVDVSALPEGVYNIAIVTVGKGTFKGEFQK
ncbi:MAG TPA: DUF3244 domain-containing protein [Paludibacteraceae bacterium]|nr:DUF3244 domain-containing protein [Paludibacteraceae bacterium]